MKKILGVVLARNEEIFLARALKNAAAFCDEFLLFDHDSRDATPEILKSFNRSHPNSQLWRIEHPKESQLRLAQRAGEDAWVFGVDGDELYDPAGLAQMRRRLLSGEFDEWWMIMGHCLHGDSLDEAKAKATGWLAPPSRSITKLYNFGAIESWEGTSNERLHGGKPVFRKGYQADSKYLMHSQISWDESPLRCLHLCFCRRSPNEYQRGGRRNIAELYGRLLPPALLRAWSGLLPSAWKAERYRRGPKVTINAAPFL